MPDQFDLLLKKKPAGPDGFDAILASLPKAPTARTPVRPSPAITDIAYQPSVLQYPSSGLLNVRNDAGFNVLTNERTPSGELVIPRPASEWDEMHEERLRFRDRPRAQQALDAARAESNKGAGVGETLVNVPFRVGAGFAKAGAGIADWWANRPQRAGYLPFDVPVKNPAPTPVAESLRSWAKQDEGKMRPPEGPTAKAIDAVGQGAGNVLPALVAGFVGGPPLAAVVGGAQLGGTSYERVYQRTGDIPRSVQAGAGGIAVGTLTGGILGQNPVSKSLAGRLAEQTAEGVAYGGIQAGADEAIYSAATGDKPAWSRVPTEAGVGGAISFGLSALANLFTRGRARMTALATREPLVGVEVPQQPSPRSAETFEGEIVPRDNGAWPSSSADRGVSPKLLEHFQQRVKEATTPEQVQAVVDDARAVRNAVDADASPATPADDFDRLLSEGQTRQPAPQDEFDRLLQTQQPAAEQPATPRTFTRAAIERRLVGYHEESGAGYTAADEAELSEIYQPFTFKDKLPGEIKRHIENNPAARRLFRVTTDASASGGADAFGKLGERYFQIVDKIAGSDLKAAKDSARRSSDPAMMFWTAIHDNLPPKSERPPQVGVDPAKLSIGQQFELNGHQFQVVEDADGFRVLRDGNDYPVTPLDALAGEKIPVDKGTLKAATEPELPEGGAFDDLPQTFFNADTAGATPQQQGIFGQEVFDPATGRDTGPLFHRPLDAAPIPTDRIRASESAVNPANTPGMFPPRNPMRPKGAANIGIKPAAEVAMGAVGMGKKAFDTWSRPLIDNVAAQAGSYGKGLAASMREANDRAREIVGQLHPFTQRYLDSVSGAPGKDFVARRRAMGELQQRLGPKGKDFAFSKAQLAVEGKIPLSTLSPAAQQAVLLRRKLTEELGKLAVAEGVQVVDATTKKVRPFIPAKDGQRWFRAFTPEMRTISKLPDGSPLKQAVARAIADANGIAQPLAIQHINDLDEGPLFKRNAAEVARVLEHWPAFIKHPRTAQWVELINTDPFGSATAMVTNASRRLGYIRHFGQDLPGQSVSSDLVDQFSAAGGRQKDAMNAIRALNGIPLDHLDLGRFQPEPGTPTYNAVKAIGSAYNVLKGAALTTAAVPNLLEPFTKTLAFGGVRPWVKGLAAVARHPFASRELTAAIGARTVDRMRWMTRPGHRIEDIANGISAILTAPLRMVNEWNELHSAATGIELAKSIRAGKSPNASRVTLDVLGFSDEQINRMVNQKGTPAEYKAVATRFAERTQGSTSSPSERSIAGNNPLWRIAVPFDSWAQMTANRTGKVIASFVDALKSKSPAQTAHATHLLAKHFFGAAAVGAGTAFIYAWLSGGKEGVKIRAAEAKDDPAQFALDSLVNALLGGAAGRLYRAAESPRSTKLIEGAQSVSYPAMMLQDAVEAFNGWGKYKDQSPAERATGFVRNRFAISRAVRNVAAAWGLSEWDTKTETAVSAYYRWRREQKDLAQHLGGEYLPSPDRLEFRRKMKDAVSAMKAGRESDAQKALDEAAGMSKKGTQTVTASLRPRKMLDDLDDAQRDRLRKHIGSDAYKRLEAYDDLIEEWSLSLKYETDASPGVHARHGAGLLSLDKEGDAIEREYEPVKQKLTGDRFADMDTVAANEPLIERRKTIMAKFNRLDHIKDALNGKPNVPIDLRGLSVRELEAEMRAVITGQPAPDEFDLLLSGRR